MKGGTSVVVLAFACLLAGQAAASSANIGDKELEELHSAALRALDVHKEAPSLHGPAPEDPVVATVLSILVVVALLTGCLDIREMEEEEDKKNGVVDGIFLPTALRFVLNVVTLVNAVVFTWVLRRRWLQASSPAIPAALQLPLVRRQAAVGLSASAVASDEVTLAFTGIFVLLGIVTMCADFHTLAMDEGASEEANSKETSKEVAASDDKKDDKKVSWIQYLTAQWRLVSCVVLLCSVFLAAAAPLLENMT